MEGLVDLVDEAHHFGPLSLGDGSDYRIRPPSIHLRRPAEGASTITQQLVKAAFFGQQAAKDPLRKIREALLAQEIEGKWGKQRILDEFLEEDAHN